MLRVGIVRIDVQTRKVQAMADYVAQEKPLHIFLNRTHYATILCSPSNLKELSVGHLLSEGVVKSIEEFDEIKLEEGYCRISLVRDVDLEKRLRLLKNFSRIILSACGDRATYQPSMPLSRIRSNSTVKAEVLLNCVNRLNFLAKTFRKTGGVHGAAIHKNSGTLVAFAEDVGRHNAVDKVIGVASLKNTNFDDCFVTLTGRLTGDIVLKAARIKLPIVSSLAAAIDSGIAIAKDTNVTMIGFVRGSRMNIYTSPERIIL